MMRLNILSLLWLLVTTLLALPTEISTSPATVSKRAASVTESYFDVTSAQHQSNFNRLFGQGYGMISLSVYGQPPNHRYAAVWVQRPLPALYAIHEASAAQYQSFVTSKTADGFVPKLITVTGPEASAIYASVWEQNGVTGWYQKCGLTQSQYATELSNAQTNRFMLKSFTEYGTSSARLFCGIWYPNTQFDKYTTFIDENISQVQTTFNSETSKPLWRLSYVSVSEDRLISSQYTDLDVGSWYARAGLSAATLQSEITAQRSEGRYPLYIQGGGTGSSTQFSVLFGYNDVPTARTWRVQGSVTGFRNNAAAQNAADSMMQNFMKASGVRQAQFSVGKNGATILQRAYSWSESTRATTGVNDVFLLASNSKMFLDAAVQKMYDAGKLSPSVRVYPLLGYTSTPDPRLQNITVEMLLNHQGGLDVSASGFDAAYAMRAIAVAQNTGGAPASTRDVVDYMSRYTLDFAPGTQTHYSNYGYLLLSHAIERLTGLPFYDYLQQSVLAPGSYDVRRWGTLPGGHASDPVIQESLYTGLNAMTPLQNTRIAAVFGGDGMVKEDTFAVASLATSATTLARFISTHAVWGIGPRVPGAARTGSTPGTNTWAESRADGVDFAVVINTRDLPSGDPFFTGLCQTAMTGFFNSNPTL